MRTDAEEATAGVEIGALDKDKFPGTRVPAGKLEAVIVGVRWCGRAQGEGKFERCRGLVSEITERCFEAELVRVGVFSLAGRKHITTRDLEITVQNGAINDLARRLTHEF